MIKSYKISLFLDSKCAVVIHNQVNVKLMLHDKNWAHLKVSKLSETFSFESVAFFFVLVFIYI